MNQLAETTVRAAAVQFQGVVGDVAESVTRLENMIDEAARNGASVIGVPEFATSPLPFRPEAHRSVLPTDNAAADMFRSAARRHGCYIGGSMLVADAGMIYNRYHLWEPDGRLHTHDKDLPTMWENAFYGPGHDDGFMETGMGRVGAAVCWELIRAGTVRRLKSRVDVMMTGTHWWSMPENWGAAVNGILGPLSQYNRYLSENAPREFARRVGAPVLQASHCGPLRTDFMLVPGLDVTVPYDTHYVGATQIVDADGSVLAERHTHRGPGIVYAGIRLGAQDPVEPLETSFWIPRLPLAHRLYWHHQNACAKSYYRRIGLRAGLAAAGRAQPHDVGTSR